ncbi:MAG: GntR family transcriptional regulator [Clostridia bacterium]|nr:GntR family transcriptional regulator [Clostridia bacterium]
MLVIDKYSAKPIYEQIIDGIEKDILLGILNEGDAVPSVRELSVTLGINPNTVQKAYIELDRRSIIISGHGVGSFVKSGALAAIKESERKKLEHLHRLASELYLAGVAKEELFDVIDRAYKQKEEDKDDQRK